MLCHRARLAFGRPGSWHRRSEVGETPHLQPSPQATLCSASVRRPIFVAGFIFPAGSL